MILMKKKSVQENFFILSQLIEEKKNPPFSNILLHLNLIYLMDTIWDAFIRVIMTIIQMSIEP